MPASFVTDVTTRRTVRSRLQDSLALDTRIHQLVPCQESEMLATSDSMRRNRALAGIIPSNSSERHGTGTKTDLVTDERVEHQHVPRPSESFNIPCGLVSPLQKISRKSDTPTSSYQEVPPPWLLVSRLNRKIYENGLIIHLADHYWPYSISGPSYQPWAIFHHTSDVSKVADVARCSLLFLCAGNVEHDEPMIQEGDRRRVAAVECLRQEVALGVHDGGFDAVSMLVSILYLLTGEMVKSATADATAWRKHVDGMAAIVQAARLPKSLSIQGRQALLRVRQLCLVSALWDRRALDTRRFDYQLHGITQPGVTERLTRLAMSLPLLLELTDSLRRQISPELAPVKRLHSRLVQLETELEAWHSIFCKSAIVQGSFCSHDPSQTARKSPSTSQETSAATPLAKLDRLCRPCFLSAHCFAFHATCVLLVLQALLHLASLPGMRSLPHVQLKVNDVARRLCEFVTYFDAVTQGIFKRVTAVHGSLRFLSRYFTETADCERMRWAADIEQRLQAEHCFVAWDATIPWSFFSMSIMFDYD